MKRRFNPFTGELDDSGAIVGFYGYIGHSADAQELGEFLNSGYRSYFNPSTYSTSIYVDADNGNDDTGDGTSGSPYESLRRAISDIGQSNKTSATIRCAYATNSYDFDFNPTNTIRFTIEGTPDIEDTYTVSGTATADRRSGIAVTVTDTLVADELKGRILYLQGRLGNQRQILVYGNTTSTIYGRMTSRTGYDSAQFSWTGGTLQLMRFPVVNNTSTDTLIVGNLEFTLSKIKMTGNNLYVEAGRLTFQWSEIDDITQIGGEVFMVSSIFNPAGSATFPAIHAYAGARFRPYCGTVLTDKNCPVASTDSYFLSATFGASMEEVGGIDFVGLGENGIELVGTNFGEAGWFIANQAPIYFVDYAGATCKAGFVVESERSITIFDSYRSASSRVYIGECYGTIDTGGYLATGQRGSYIWIDPTSEVTTDFGINAVSADGGTSLCSRAPDGTAIINGTPHYSAKWNEYTETSSSTYTVLTTDATVVADTSSAAVEFDLPDATTLQAGAGYTLGVEGSNTLTIDPNGSQTISYLGVAYSTINLSPGEYIDIFTDGANWFVK